MVDRFLSWIGVGVLAAGLSAGVLAGAGLAAATEGAASDGTGTSTSSNPEAKKQDSTKTPDHSKGSEAGDKKGDPADNPTKVVTTGPTDVDANEDKKDDTHKDDLPKGTKDTGTKDTGTKDTGTKDTGTKDTGTKDTDVTSGLQQQVNPAGNSRDKGAQPKLDLKVAKDTTPQQPSQQPVGNASTLDGSTKIDKVVSVESTISVEQAAGQRGVMQMQMVPTAPDEPDSSAVTFAAPAVAAIDATASTPQIPGIIRVIGTIVFNLYGFAIQVFGGPPIVNNANVTVRSSTLHLDCGCNNGQGVDVPADWYVPQTAPDEAPPTRLIYLQHGFLAAGPWYSFTASALADETHSIVVAPSITSNFLAADACWLGAPPIHKAIADLFSEDNTALADSALAAGYAGPIPDRVVLMGHSLGGGAVAGAAGYMSEDPYSAARLAGVVLLDGVGLDENAMAEGLAKVADDVPIYQLAAPKYFWNQFGVGTTALLQARPEAGRFIGVTLVGGSHVDSMRGGNPIIQFSQQLVAGFSTPQNVDAASMLMVGWVNDMFDGLGPTDPGRVGIYPDAADPTAPISIDTADGEATAVPLPNSLTKPFILNLLQAFVPMGSGIFTFDPVCVDQSMSVCSASVAA